MKKLLILSVVLTCCGTENTERKLVFQDPPRCLNCGQDYVPEEIEIPAPRPRVLLYPSELLFYYTSNTERPYPTQYISVVNKTNGSVVITDAFIVADDSCWICGGGMHFVLADQNLPYVLERNESLLLGISFLYSDVQQSAVLEVYTTFEPDYFLRASLSGKVFIW